MIKIDFQSVLDGMLSVTDGNGRKISLSRIGAKIQDHEGVTRIIPWSFIAQVKIDNRPQPNHRFRNDFCGSGSTSEIRDGSTRFDANGFPRDAKPGIDLPPQADSYGF